jgi:hypothetical protein
VHKFGKDDSFTFHRSKNQVRGYIIRLTAQLDGNLERPKIAAADF